MPVKASESLHTFIKQAEGYRAKPYQDAGGKTAVGYGSTDGGAKGAVSEAEADRMLRDRVALAENELSAVISRKDLTEGQMDALVDMHYNLGGQTMTTNGFIDMVNSGRDSEVSQEIQKYTKAKNSKTGQMEELPGLVNRVKQRSIWWNGVQVPQEAILGLPDSNTQELVDSMDEFDRSKEAPAAVGLLGIDPEPEHEINQDALINRTMDQFDAIGVIAPEHVDDRIRQMENARGIVSKPEADRVQKVKDLSSELGIDPLIIDADLEVYSEEEIRTRAKIPQIAKDFPVLSKWANTPENYVLMESTGDWTTALTRATQNLNPALQNDFQNTLKSSALEYPKAAIYTLMLYGSLDPKSAGKALKQIRHQQTSLAVSKQAQEQLGRLEEVSSALTPKLKTLVESAGDAWDAASDDDINTAILPELQKVYDGTVDAFGGVLDYLATMYENPKGAGLTATQAAVSSGLPLAVGLGATAVGRPIIGAVGAFSTSAMLSVAESIQKDLEEFRDINTGEVDLEAAFADPERVSKWRKRAGVYGAVMGVSDAIYSRFLGKGFSKVVKNKVAKTAVSGAVEEGASQFTASVAREAVTGDVTSDVIAEAGTEALTEAIYGGILGGGIGAASSVYTTGKQKFYKIKTSLDEATKASNDMVDMHEAKTVLKQDEARNTNKVQVKSLIEEVVQPPPIPDNTSIYEDVEEVAESEAKMRENESLNGVVQVAPSELIDFFADQNLSADDVLQTLPPAIYDQFVNNKESDQSITIDIADWMQVLEDFPEVDEIVRINGNDLNAQEAGAVVEGIQENPFSLYSEKTDGDQPPALPGEEAVLPDLPGETQVIEESFDDSEIIGVSEIKTRFRNEDDTKAYNSLKSRLSKGTTGLKGIPKDSVKVFTEIQFARVKNRAEILGLEVSEVVKSQAVASPVHSNQFHGAFNPLSTRIVFAKTATPTVMVHEFGHSWLNEMSEDYTYLSNIPVDQMTPAQRDYWYSMQKSAEVLGLANIGILNSLDKNSDEFIRAHETFAQTAEEYFLSGEFGNSKIRAVMESFRKYMTSIIETIRRYAQNSKYPTLNINAEIQRMFDGILGVDYKQDEFVTPMFADPLFDPSELGDRASEYYETTRDALSESVGIFASKIMNASYNEREKLIDGALNDAFDKATAIVDSSPEMVLADQMKDQYDEYRKLVKAGKKVPDPRISYKSFIALFGGDENAAEIARQSIPAFAIAGKKKGGVEASLFMYNLGFTDPRDMINTLMIMGTRDQLVEQKAESIIEQEFPILKSDEAIRDEAVGSLSNQRVGKFLQMEMKILAEQYLPTLKNLAELFITTPETMRNSDNIKNKAAEMVTDSKAYKFTTRSFRVDYGRLARKSAIAFRKGDFAAAFDAKVRSAISYQASVLAQDVQRRMATTNKRIKQFKKYTKSRDYAKRYNTEIMLFGKAFIEAVNENTTNLPVLDIEMFPDGSGVTQSSVDSINRYVSDFNARSKGRHGVYITAGSYVELGEAVKYIQKQARLAKETEVANKMIKLEEVQQRVAAEIEGSESRSISYEARSYGHYKIAKDSMYTVFSSLYPSDVAFTSSVLGTVLSDLEDGQAERNIVTREDTNVLVAAFEKIAKTSQNTNIENILGPIVKRLPFAGSVWKYDRQSQPIVATELGITFNNMSEYIMAELLMGSPSGAEKFLRGGTIANPNPIAGFGLDGKVDTAGWEALRARLISEKLLKKEHFDAMQTIWDLLRVKQPDLKKAFRETDGFLIGNIEGWDVKTPWGTYKGGYVPLAQDKQLNDAATFETLIDPDTNNLSPSALFPRQNTGMTNQRNDNHFPADLDPNRIMMYVAAANDLIHMRSPLMTIGKVFTSPDVRQALELKRPGAFKNMLTPWFDRVKNQQRTEKSADITNKIALKLRKNINRSIYLFRVMTPLKQVFGLVPALSSVKPQFLLRSTIDVSMRPMDSVKEVSSKSRVMQDRFEATVRRHINEWDELKTNFDWVARADEVVDKVTFIAIQGMQNRVDASIWLGAIRQAEAQHNMTEAQKIHFADTAVQATQSSSTVSYLNNLQTASAISKFIQGIATSYIFAINNVVTKEGMRNPTKVAQAKTLMAIGILYFLIPNLLDQGLEEAFKAAFEEEEDDETELEARLENIAKRAAVGTLSTIAPIVGNVPSSYMYSGSTDFAPIFTKLARETTLSANGVTKNTQGVNMTPREMKALLHTITLWTGIPTSALAKDIFVEEVWIEGLNGETLDARLRERKYQLRKQKWEEGRNQ